MPRMSTHMHQVYEWPDTSINSVIVQIRQPPLECSHTSVKRPL